MYVFIEYANMIYAENHFWSVISTVVVRNQLEISYSERKSRLKAQTDVEFWLEQVKPQQKKGNFYRRI